MAVQKILLVIDMQNDFVTGALGNEEAAKIIAPIGKKIETYQSQGLPVFFTRDAHGEDYLNTQEGRLLPVPHCRRGTAGWQIADGLKCYAQEDKTFDKPTFGSLQLPAWIEEKLGGIPGEIQLCGVCTDICVISNAMILKAAFPETIVTVDQSCCAGVTPQSHHTAIEAMKACQIIIE